MEIDWDVIVHNTVEKERERRAAAAAAERADLERYRLRKNPLSQTQLARISGVHHTTLNRFLRGQSVRSDAADRIKMTIESLGVVDVAQLGETAQAHA